MPNGKRRNERSRERGRIEGTRCPFLPFTVVQEQQGAHYLPYVKKNELRIPSALPTIIYEMTSEVLRFMF